MKIGILTYYRSHNYGAMLQAFALRKVLHDMGHEAVFIDYWPRHQKKAYRLFAWEEFWRGGIRGRISYLKRFLKSLIPKLMRRRNFNRFYCEQIRPYISPQDINYDVIVCGSDQIWRKQGWGYGYNPVYFGKNDFDTKRHISYAASMGGLPEDIEDVNKVLNLITNIDDISVRELDLLNFLNNHGINDVIQTIDPTFLLTKDKWEHYIKKERIIKYPYLLFYDLQIGAIDFIEVEEFAKSLGLKVIRISGWVVSMPTEENRIADGPYEFLNLIFNSDFVITSSFHGLAFSLIFHKPFFASLLRDKSRIESLLQELNLSDRLVSINCKFIGTKVNDIDWKYVSKVIDVKRNYSIEFLTKTINKTA